MTTPLSDSLDDFLDRAIVVRQQDPPAGSWLSRAPSFRPTENHLRWCAADAQILAIGSLSLFLLPAASVVVAVRGPRNALQPDRRVIEVGDNTIELFFTPRAPDCERTSLQQPYL